MNWLKKNIMEWALAQVKSEGRKNIGTIHVGALTSTRDEALRSDALSNCEQLRFTIIPWAAFCRGCPWPLLMALPLQLDKQLNVVLSFFQIFDAILRSPA